MRWEIGTVTVTKVVDLEATGGLRFLLPQATPEAVAPMRWMVPHFMTPEGRLRASVHALVIRTPERRILVDTCIGNDKRGLAIDAWNGRNGPFLDDLRAGGHTPEEIDTVLCTHLHVDHVGWNTHLVDGRWKPTFPNARYLFARTEYEHWHDTGGSDAQRQSFVDSVQPVVDAGLVELVEPEHQVCPEVRLVPTPGHTPGHVSVQIVSEGHEAVITGDVLHHPCQMARPDWGSTADHDAAMAHGTRRRLCERMAESGALMIGTHFAGCSSGRVVRSGDAFMLSTEPGVGS